MHCVKVVFVGLCVLCRQVNGVDIVVTTDDARLSPFMVTETLATPTDGAARRSHKSSVSETDSRMFGGSSSAMSYASSFDPDNIALRHPVYSGFVLCLYKGSAMWTYIAPSCETSKALRHGSHSFTCKQHFACLYLVNIHQMAPSLIMVADI